MPKAVEYIMSIYDTIGSLDEALQMSIIEVIRLDCKDDSSHRVRPFSDFTRYPSNRCVGKIHAVYL